MALTGGGAAVTWMTTEHQRRERECSRGRGLEERREGRGSWSAESWGGTVGPDALEGGRQTDRPPASQVPKGPMSVLLAARSSDSAFIWTPLSHHRHLLGLSSSVRFSGKPSAALRSAGHGVLPLELWPVDLHILTSSHRPGSIQASRRGGTGEWASDTKRDREASFMASSNLAVESSFRASLGGWPSLFQEPPSSKKNTPLPFSSKPSSM